jgi:hypothetical protein
MPCDGLCASQLLFQQSGDFDIVDVFVRGEALKCQRFRGNCRVSLTPPIGTP